MSRPRPSGRDGSTDRGISLIEVLIAVALLGLAVATVIPSMLGSVRGSALQDRFAGARRWIMSAGDYAVSEELPRIPCAHAADYLGPIQAAAQAHRPDGWTDAQLSVTGVQYWDGTTFAATCVETAALPLHLQQISLRVVSPDGRVVETLDVVKADG